MSSKKIPALFGAVAIIFLVSCTLQPQTPKPTNASIEPTSVGVSSQAASANLSVFVAMANGPMLPGATVYIAGPNGLQVAGTTDLSGLLDLSWDQLIAANAFALIACSKDFTCGAKLIRTRHEEQTPEFFIPLAPASIR